MNINLYDYKCAFIVKCSLAANFKLSRLSQEEFHGDSILSHLLDTF